MHRPLNFASLRRTDEGIYECFGTFHEEPSVRLKRSSSVESVFPLTISLDATVDIVKLNDHTPIRGWTSHKRMAECIGVLIWQTCWWMLCPGPLNPSIDLKKHKVQWGNICDSGFLQRKCHLLQQLCTQCTSSIFLLGDLQDRDQSFGLWLWMSGSWFQSSAFPPVVLTIYNSSICGFMELWPHGA